MHNVHEIYISHAHAHACCRLLYVKLDMNETYAGTPHKFTIRMPS